MKINICRTQGKYSIWVHCSEFISWFTFLKLPTFVIHLYVSRREFISSPILSLCGIKFFIKADLKDLLILISRPSTHNASSVTILQVVLECTINRLLSPFFKPWQKFNFDFETWKYFHKTQPRPLSLQLFQF